MSRRTLSGSTSPMAAQCTGLTDRSAAFTSQTVVTSNQTSGVSLGFVPYLHPNQGLQLLGLYGISGFECRDDQVWCSLMQALSLMP